MDVEKRGSQSSSLQRRSVKEYVIARHEAISMLYRATLHGAYPLLAAGGPVTFIATKVTKRSSQQKCFFAAPGLARKSVRTTGCNYFAQLRTHNSTSSAKTCYAPSTAQAIIVLPAFARSCSADGKRISNHVIARRDDEAISLYI